MDAWRSAYRGPVPNERLACLSYARSEERFVGSIRDGAEETYIAEEAGEAGEAVGFLSLGPCRDDDFDTKVTRGIRGFCLPSPHWRRGIAKPLCWFQDPRGRSPDSLPRRSRVEHLEVHRLCLELASDG